VIDQSRAEQALLFCMKFSIVFDNSNDSIEFDVVYNSDLLLYMVDQANAKQCNAYTDTGVVAKTVNRCLADINHSVELSNSVLSQLKVQTFPARTNLMEYLDQQVLNSLHAQWVQSQASEFDIDALRFAQDQLPAQVGWRLHDMYPDEIRQVKLAEIMIKLGYIAPYEDVNMSVHRLEHFWAKKIEYKSAAKWDVFENPYKDTMISNNDVVTFSFGYTYVGRQFYNKWQYWDNDLQYNDHYNYETLEHAFQLCFDRPQTIAYSPEFLIWCQRHNVKPVTTQIPIANAVDIDKNLTYYRTVVYTNSKAGNSAKIVIH